MNRVFVALSAVLLGGALIASAATPPKITRVGDVNLTIMSMPMPVPGMPSRDMIMGNGSFYQGPGRAANAKTVDQCFLSVEAKEGSGLPSNIPGRDTPSKDPLTLDAGDPLSLRQGAQPYTTMPRKKSGKLIAYATAMPNALKAPTSGLVLDVPGAAGGFPAMKNKAFPVVSALNLTAPKTSDPVTPSTPFSWSNPSNDPATQVMLISRQEDKKLNVVCLAIDDGKFNFPPSTVKELTAKGFSKGKLSMLGRIGNRQYLEGDAQLNLSTMVMQPVMDMGMDDEETPDDSGN